MFKTGLLSRLGAQFNAAYIETSVDLGKQAVGQSTERPLMGQSPYVVNAGLYYTDTASRFQCNVLYNVIGPRLFAAGTFGTPTSTRCRATWWTSRSPKAWASTST